MDLGELLHEIKRAVDDLRAAYIEDGRGPDFDRFVAAERARGQWPFDE
jgi:hypothetical protein